ncbi:MAG: tetratricopeptide repeat protein [Xenococcaceae cyanobacterium MO_188.B19]|nr:tetratricopeptide repeat protein [Xenococcaceae cyanobacterium MO_188.B19]
MAKRKARKKAWGFGSDSQTLNKCLQEFDKYIVKNKWSKAQKIVEELEQRFSSKKEVLECWLTLAYAQNDWTTYQQKATEYTLKHPDEPDAYLTLSSVCLKNTYPLLALEALEKFCQKFPNHAKIPEAKQTIEEIQAIVPELLKDYDLEGQQALEVGRLSEQGRFLFESNQYTDASKILKELISLAPKFPPAFNNLSLIRCFEGDLTEAIALAQQVLEYDQNNFQALGNLVRFYLLSGKTELAEQYLNDLKALDNIISDVWLKKAESLSLFGDWPGLVELEKEAEASDVSEDLTAVFWHCIAVAHANLEQEKKARQLWQKSLKITPTFEYARQNLDNIKLPVGERDTPWAFEITEWFSSKIREDITQMVSDSEIKNDNQSQSIAKRIIKKNPHILPLIPILLKRGSPSGRKFAIYMATLTKKPELVAALKEFAFGRDGSDQERIEVAQQLNQEGLIPSGNIKMWVKGEHTELLLMGMEINDEPTVTHSQKVGKLGQRAVLCLKMGDSEEAESILLEALKLEPSAPDLKFNLANSYMLQDRVEEAYDLLHKIHKEHPDYTFAAISLANHYIHNKELEKAEEILKPLLRKKQFNYQEFCKLCETHIQLAVKKKTPEAAFSWLNMWKQLADEDDPDLDYWCNRLEKKSSRFWQ